VKKTIVITLLLASLVLLLQGCGVAKGCGRAVGSIFEGVGYIGSGIKEDLAAASGSETIK